MSTTSKFLNYKHSTAIVLSNKKRVRCSICGKLDHNRRNKMHRPVWTAVKNGMPEPEAIALGRTFMGKTMLAMEDMADRNPHRTAFLAFSGLSGRFPR
jgi:hypothetical protein